MKARHALGGLALVLGMTLPAAAQTPDDVQLTQAQPDAPRPGMGERRQGPIELDREAVAWCLRQADAAWHDGVIDRPLEVAAHLRGGLTGILGGAPRAVSASRPRTSCQLWSASLAKPSPGSTTTSAMRPAVRPMRMIWSGSSVWT